MGISTSKETNAFMKLNLSSSYSSLEEYVQETLSKLENDTLTRLRLDDFSYPDLDLEGWEFFDGSTIARILRKAVDAPSLQELEFRFLEIDQEIATELLNLLHSREVAFSQVSIVGCSAPVDFFVGLADSIPKCQRLILNHNHIPPEGNVALGQALADPTKNTTLKSLHLKREHIFGYHARALFQGLQQQNPDNNETLTELVLNFCRFQDDGVEALCNCLQSNRSIRILDMGACYLSDQHVAQLIQSLHTGEHPLEELTLTLNSCHRLGIDTMREFLSSSNTATTTSTCRLRSLDLSHQKDDRRKLYLGPLVEALRVNRTLTTLKLSRNRLGSEDIEPLLEALQENSTLEHLDLNNNVIGNEGAERIARALSCHQDRHHQRHHRGLSKLYLLNNEIDSNKSSLVLAEAVKVNRQLEVLEIRPTLKHVPDIQFYTSLNWAGRKLIGSDDRAVPLGLWPTVLERAQKTKSNSFVPSILFQLLVESTVVVRNR